MVLNDILQELVMIRKELQTIRRCLEPNAKWIREPYGRKSILNPAHGKGQSQQKESGESPSYESF